MAANMTLSVTSPIPSSSTTTENNYKYVYVCFALGAAILVVTIVLVTLLIVKHRQCSKSHKATSTTSVLKTSLFYDRRLAGNSMVAAVQCFRPVSNSLEQFANVDDPEFIWFTGSTRSEDTRTTSGRVSPGGDVKGAPVSSRRLMTYIEHKDGLLTSSIRTTLHRSSPLATLREIFAEKNAPDGGTEIELPRKLRSDKTNSGHGCDNRGFVGDERNGGFEKVKIEMTTATANEWSRLSWRARLRAGICDSGVTTSTSACSDSIYEHDQPQHRNNEVLDRRQSYLSEVVDHVRFLSGDLAASGSGSKPTDDDEGRRMSKFKRSSSSLSSSVVEVIPDNFYDPMRSLDSTGGEWHLRRPDIITTALGLPVSCHCESQCSGLRSLTSATSSSFRHGQLPMRFDNDDNDVNGNGRKPLPDSWRNSNGLLATVQPAECGKYFTPSRPLDNTEVCQTSPPIWELSASVNFPSYG